MKEKRRDRATVEPPPWRLDSDPSHGSRPAIVGRRNQVVLEAENERGEERPDRSQPVIQNPCLTQPNPPN